MHGNPEKNCLVKVLDPLLRKLSPTSWDVLNMSVMWNVKKPVWFQVGEGMQIFPFFSCRRMSSYFLSLGPTRPAGAVLPPADGRPAGRRGGGPHLDAVARARGHQEDEREHPGRGADHAAVILPGEMGDTRFKTQILRKLVSFAPEIPPGAPFFRKPVTNKILTTIEFLYF